MFTSFFGCLVICLLCVCPRHQTPVARAQLARVKKEQNCFYTAHTLPFLTGFRWGLAYKVIRENEHATSHYSYWGDNEYTKTLNSNYSVDSLNNWWITGEVVNNSSENLYKLPLGVIMVLSGIIFSFFFPLKDQAPSRRLVNNRAWLVWNPTPESRESHWGIMSK